MTQRTIKIFICEIYSNPHKKNYPTNKTDVYHIDDIWSLDKLDLKDFGPENNKGYRYVLVAIDNFSKFNFFRTIPLKKKNAYRREDSFENNLINSKTKPKVIETDRGKKIYNKVFQNQLNNIKHYSRNTEKGAVSAERFNRTIKDLLKRPVFEKEDGNWIDVLPTLIKTIY